MVCFPPPSFQCWRWNLIHHKIYTFPFFTVSYYLIFNLKALNSYLSCPLSCLLRKGIRHLSFPYVNPDARFLQSGWLPCWDIKKSWKYVCFMKSAPLLCDICLRVSVVMIFFMMSVAFYNFCSQMLIGPFNWCTEECCSSQRSSKAQQSLGWGLEGRWLMAGWTCYGLLTLLHKGGANFCGEVFPLTATNEGTQRAVI